MVTWTDTSSWSRGEKDRSQPKQYTANIGAFRLTVHRHIHYPPCVWLATCHPDVMLHVELAASDAGEAKCQAVAMLQAICQEAIDEIAAPAP